MAWLSVGFVTMFVIKEDYGSGKGGDFYPTSPASSIVAVLSPWSKNLKESSAITVAIAPPINSGSRNPP